MRSAQIGDTVKLHYTGRLENGSVFATSAEGDPLEFEVGKKGLLTGLEQAIVGMVPGDKKQTRLEAEQAYGSYRQELVMEIEAGKIAEGPPAEVGQQVQLTSSDGKVIPARVTAVSEERVTVDANHPLAGNNVEFDLELIEIR